MRKINKNWEIISSSLVPPFEAALTNKEALGQGKRIVEGERRNEWYQV